MPVVDFMLVLLHFYWQSINCPLRKLEIDFNDAQA